jgi:hypothetical protein
MMSTQRLTKPQRDLLDEIRASDTGGLWIHLYGRYGRTALALERRGLVQRTDWHHSQVFFIPTPTGNGGAS